MSNSHSASVQRRCCWALLISTRSVPHPGVFAQRGSPPRIVLGEETGEISDRAQSVAEVLEGAGIDAEVSPNVLTALWSKLVYICALSGMSCITRASFTDVLETPETYAMTMQVMTEALKVGAGERRAAGRRIAWFGDGRILGGNGWTYILDAH